VRKAGVQSLQEAIVGSLSKSALWILAALVACGVSAQAARRELLAPTPAPDVFSRAVTVLTEFGYTIENADREAGFIKADRQFGGFLNPHHWQLSITLLPDSTGTRIVLQPANLGDRGTVAQGRVLPVQEAHLDSVLTRLRSVLRIGGS
jgi:hypothetical protein